MRKNIKIKKYKKTKELNENTLENINSFLNITLGEIGTYCTEDTLYCDKIRWLKLNPTLIGLATASSALVLLESASMGFLKEELGRTKYIDDSLIKGKIYKK